MFHAARSCGNQCHNIKRHFLFFLRARCLQFSSLRALSCGKSSFLTGKLLTRAPKRSSSWGMLTTWTLSPLACGTESVVMNC